MSIPPANFFFKSILSHKNWRGGAIDICKIYAPPKSMGGGKWFLKNVQNMVTPTNHVIARAGFTLRWASGAEPMALWDFRNIFLPNTGKDPKNVSPSDRGAPGTVP